MGLNKVTKTPCGFSFVEYYTTGDARDAVKYVSGATLDDRVIRIDLDIGFEEGRQYGRGRGGGQVSFHTTQHITNKQTHSSHTHLHISTYTYKEINPLLMKITGSWWL